MPLLVPGYDLDGIDVDIDIDAQEAIHMESCATRHRRVEVSDTCGVGRDLMRATCTGRILFRCRSCPPESCIGDEGACPSRFVEWRNKRNRCSLAILPRNTGYKCTVEPVELEQSREKTIQFDAEMERTRRAPEITGKVHSALEPICETS